MRVARSAVVGLVLIGALLAPGPAAAARPDGVLFQEARHAEATLHASPKLQADSSVWEHVIMRYRKVVARYPKSGYCDDSLLAIGNLYRQMAIQFKTPKYNDDAVQAYKLLVAEYPSSRLGEKALFAVVEVAQESGDRKRLAEAGRAYLAACPDAERAAQIKALLRKKAPVQAASLPSPPPPGLAQVYDLRFWSGESSTRVVIDLEKKIPLRYDRISDPERLWVDLVGTRLHPNLTSRSFPVGDGLLEKVRIGQNKDDVVRVVLDFKDVKEHSVFYLEDPTRTRLVVDVRGTPRPGEGPRSSAPPEASAGSRGAGPAPTSPASPETIDRLPSRRMTAMLEPPLGAARARSNPRIAIEGAEPPRRAAASVAVAPAPPEVNRAGSYSLARQLGLGARRIVIDAGHGGHDPGTIGRGGLQEKDLVLDVCLRLEKLVRTELGAEVIMTRSSDAYVALEERTAIANSKAADLFLSVHANSSRNPTARGIETYFLNFAGTPHAEAVAARENAISAATLKDLQGLVKAITLNSKIDESRDFAASVQEAMVEHLRTRHPVEDRGVHTAPFYVLIGANMPSILAEIAFVSNPEDEKRLKTNEYREAIAQSLLKGVRSYLEALSRTQTRQLTGSGRRSTVAEREGSR
ncbi:MAG TPA: N-acetylmuramoyl-L-alanine amidase [Vicinamibacteria bacterium]|nr:N-acetylmuramoyl-L-alanine amidase [Vicinamibacteria bacterium]